MPCCTWLLNFSTVKPTVWCVSISCRGRKGNPSSLFSSVPSAYVQVEVSCVPSRGLKCGCPALALLWGLVGKDSGWEGGRAGLWALLCATLGPLSILSLPEPVPQHLNGIQYFLFSHHVCVTVGPFFVFVGNGNPNCFSLACLKCCWGTKSGKPLQEKNKQCINRHQQCLGWVILGVSSSFREHERVKQGLLPDGHQNLFNLCFNLYLLV